MAKLGKVKIRLPSSIKKGEVVLKAIIIHPMNRPKDDSKGYYVNKVEITYAGKKVGSYTVTPGISVNPFFAFKIKAMKEGKVEIKFTDTKGLSFTGSKDIKFS